MEPKIKPAPKKEKLSTIWSRRKNKYKIYTPMNHPLIKGEG